MSVDTLLKGVETAAEYVLAFCDGGFTTNLPLEDVIGGKAWVAYSYEGEPLAPEHGGPARLLVPHLYFWKSAKWVRGLRLLSEEELYRRAVTAASAGEGHYLAKFAGRFLYAHQRLRDSLTDLAGGLDTMSAPSYAKSPSGGAAS